MATSKNPPWLDALLASAYPGGTGDMSAFGAQGYPVNPWNQMNPEPPQGAGGKVPDILAPIQGADPRILPAQPRSTQRNAYSPPVPNPSNVGGAPSPGIPAPQGANRTANNPNYSLVQYQTPNSQGGRAPIYTAANFGGPQNAGWGQQGQFPQQQQRQAQPNGALANPQGGGSGFNVAGMFQNLDPTTFDGSTDTSAATMRTGAPYGPSPNALPQAQKYGWPFNMVGQ